MGDFLSDIDAYEQLECVRIDDRGVAEMDRHVRVIFVPREDIVQPLELEYGSGAENPLVVMLLGLFFAALAIAGIATLVLALTRGSVRVRTRRGTRELVFHETRDEIAIREFLHRARRRFAFV